MGDTPTPGRYDTPASHAKEKAESPEAQALSKQEKARYMHLLHMAEIGSHFVKFITACRMLNQDPAAVVLFMEQKNNESREKDPTIPYLPITALVQWVEESSEENFQILSKAFNLDFDKAVEMIKKAREDRKSEKKDAPPCSNT